MAKIIMNHYATGEYREIAHGYRTDLDAQKDAQQFARGIRQAAFIVVTDDDKWLVQYGPADQIKRFNWR